MFVKLVVLFNIVAAIEMAEVWRGPIAGGKPASSHPAGINPEACPNYPHCENPFVALHPAPVQGLYGNNAPQSGTYSNNHQQWNQASSNGGYNSNNQQQWNQGNSNHQQWNRGNTNQAYNHQQWNQGNSNQQQWNQGNSNDAYNSNNQGNSGSWQNPKTALDKGEYIGDGDYRGEGLAESGAYGPVHYDNAGYNGGQNYAGAYNHKSAALKIPEGVDPNACPNYPFCV